MKHITCYLLVCTILLTMVMCANLARVSRQGIGLQCREKGFFGACRTQNEMNGELICSSLACAASSRGGPFFALYRGPIADGTPCAQNKICSNRECVPGNPPAYMEYTVGEITDCIIKKPRPKTTQSLLRKALAKSWSERDFDRLQIS